MAATETQQGIAKVFAMDGATVVTLTGAATITQESADIEQQYDLEEIKGQNGEVETLIGSNENYPVTIQFAPNGATRAAAIASAANSWPGLITKVVLSGFSIAKYNGNFNAMPGATGKLVKDGAFVMTLRLKAYITNRNSLTNGVISG